MSLTGATLFIAIATTALAVGSGATLLYMRHDDEDQGQEPEHTRFYHLDHSWSFDGEDHAISVAAYKLHINGTADATLCGHPGFVPDEYLNSLGTETTITAIDLVSLRIAT